MNDYQEYVSRTSGFRGTDNRTKFVEPTISYRASKPHLQPPLFTIPEKKSKFNPPLVVDRTPKRTARPRTAVQSGGKKVIRLGEKFLWYFLKNKFNSLEIFRKMKDFY